MKALLQKIRQILRDRKTRRIFTRFVSTIAAIVVFVTTYALVLPAITMEGEAACGIEAHQHNQSCYTDVLVCEIPERPGHMHDESCYITKQELVCRIEKHAHDSYCYDENGELICEKTEHQHRDDCFEEKRELVCETPESSGHAHTDGCYEKVLTCGREVHTHSAACYRVNPANQAATEAVAVASTESAAAADENGLDDSLDASFDNGLAEDAATALINEVSTDEAGEWVSTGEAADATTGTSAATAATDAEEINTEPSFVEPGGNPDPGTEVIVDAVDAVNADDTEAAVANSKQDDNQDSKAEDGVPDNAGTEQVNYPAVSFDDSITVTSGVLSTDTDAMSGDAGTETGTETEIIVHVEADKDTFPEGTTMVLSAVSEDQMTAVAEAVEGAVEAPKTRGFHAVDISFRDAEGNEIEPLKPIRVSMTSEAIKRAVEDESTAPVVVHIEDSHADELSMDLDEMNKDSVEEQNKSESNGSIQTAPEAAVIETITNKEESDSKDSADTLTFEAGEFSVYAIVYTVDFHYEINGNVYEFRIPGGGFVSLEYVVELLGIASADENAENAAESAEKNAETGDESEREVPGVDVSGENSTAYKEAVKLNEVEVSETAKKFVADVESVEFSNPELMWVGKVDEMTTIGGIKENKGIEVEYSAELTEEEIAEINAQMVEAEDWILISMKPFDTEESMNVTMNNGDTWTVKVTDSRNVADLDELHNKADGKTKFILWTESNGVAYALKRDGTTEIIDKNSIDTLSADFTWTIEYKYNSADLQYFRVRPSDSDNSSLGLYIRDEYNNPPLVLPGASEVNIRPKTDGKGGFEIEGWNYTKLVFDNNTKEITSAQGEYITPVRIKITEQNKSKFSFRVASEDFTMGYVSGIDANNVNQAETAEYQSITKDNSRKTNNNTISAVARSPKYLFDYWDLNGTRLSNGAVINADTLPITIDGSLLTAHFRRNPDYEASDDEKQGRAIKRELGEWIENLINQQVPLDDAATHKTAEVHDYENRIYRVDITSRSNMKTFDGKVDIGFSIDWSGSMNFPSKIKQVTGFKESQFSNNLINDLPLGDINSDYWHKTGWLDTSKTYYIITNRTMTADQFRIWYDPNDKEWVQDAWGNWHEMGIWKYSMAYYTENDPAYSTKITPDVRINAADGYLRDLTYAMYEDDSNGRLRVDDLRSSVSSTITHMNSILSQISLAKNSSENPQVKIAWNDFHWKVPESHKTFQSVTDPNVAIDPQVITEGGTRADLGLEDALGFQWEPGSRKYMVLITDGAPQPSSGQRYPNQGGWTDQMVQDRTKQFARQMKDQGVTLLTIGLSMSDVKVGSVLLYDIASRDSVNEPYFYCADSGDELEYALYEILQTILKDATVIGDVTDTVNEAFYPVDKETGETLTPSAGQSYYIDLDGNAFRGSNGKPVTTAPQNVPYGRIEASGSTYKVTWENQEFTSAGWGGTIYEKAKEDFLGGNVVKTNQGNAEIQSKGYIVDGTSNFVEFNNETKEKGYKTLETPRVNVNELNFTENTTEWTVYLGTEVDPEAEIRELFNNIKVEEVVNAAVDTDGNDLPDRITGTAHNYEYMESPRDDRQTRGEPVTFLLKDLIVKLPPEEKNKLDWDEILRRSELPDAENTGVSLKYGIYDQDVENAGAITIKLIRDHDPEKHYTDTTGSPVETYTLVVEFSPEYAHRPIASGGDGTYPYHTGDHGLKEAGNIAGKDTSTNNHKINVFAKKLELLKADQSGDTITSDPATFVLYRKATADEYADDSVTKTELTGMAGKYVPVQTLTTSGGTVTTEALPILADNEPYYLVETKAPAGYIMLAEPLKVTIDMNGHNTWTKITDNTTSQEKSDPYVLSNRLQEATIRLLKLDDTAFDPMHTPSYDHTNDTTDASATYKIINNAGYELPSTGGPGTRLFTFLGSILILGAGVVLWSGRRRILREFI